MDGGGGFFRAFVIPGGVRVLLFQCDCKVSIAYIHIVVLALALKSEQKNCVVYTKYTTIEQIIIIYYFYV